MVGYLPMFVTKLFMLLIFSKIGNYRCIDIEIEIGGQRGMPMFNPFQTIMEMNKLASDLMSKYDLKIINLNNYGLFLFLMFFYLDHFLSPLYPVLSYSFVQIIDFDRKRKKEKLKRRSDSIGQLLKCLCELD